MEVLTVKDKYAERIEMFCEENNIDFSIQNAEEIMDGSSEEVKYGINGEQISKVQDYYKTFINP